jgi:hypothetical protein
MGIQEINIEDYSGMYQNVFRTNTNEVGFIHLDFGKNLTPQFSLLWWILRMSYQSSLLLNMTKLSYHWLVRFDQQVNTPFT